MDKKAKQTVISIEEYQPQFDFEEAEHFPPFTFPEYQKEILPQRIAAGLTDFGIVALIYSIFIVATFLEMPEGLAVNRSVIGVYGAAYFVLVTIYFLLFMLSG